MKTTIKLFNSKDEQINTFEYQWLRTITTFAIEHWKAMYTECVKVVVEYTL